jgi:hypothetical protein
LPSVIDAEHNAATNGDKPKYKQDNSKNNQLSGSQKSKHTRTDLTTYGVSKPACPKATRPMPQKRKKTPRKMAGVPQNFLQPPCIMMEAGVLLAVYLHFTF